MRKINKKYSERPSSLRYDNFYYKRAINGVLSHSKWYLKASSLYSSPSVKSALNTLYNYKCAFCEQKPIGSPAQVEHFRPKNGVANTAHTGYYWLGYEWSNLLLSCGNCNSSKGTHFNLTDENNRFLAPVYLLNKTIDNSTNFIFYEGLNNEKCLLINPEIVDPEKHFIYRASGEIESNTVEGIESILRYDLNRDELFVNGRQKIKNDIQNKFLQRFENYSDGTPVKFIIQQLMNIINEEIVENISNNGSFYSFYKKMLLDHNVFFLNKIADKKYSIPLQIAFNRVIQTLI